MMTFRKIVLAVIVAQLILGVIGVAISGIYFGADKAFGHSRQGTFTVTTSP